MNAFNQKGVAPQGGGGSFFFFLLLFALAALEPCRAVGESARGLTLAFDPALERLAVRFKAAFTEPMAITPMEPIQALRQAAAHQADFALTLGPLSPGERSLLRVRPGSRPESLRIGWEAPRLLARTTAGATEASTTLAYSEFLEFLKTGQPKSAFLLASLRSIRSAEEIRARFLLPHEIAPGEVEGFSACLLEAAALKEVVDGSATAALVFSFSANHPALSPVAFIVEEKEILPTPEAVRSGDYPLAREILLTSSRDYEPGSQPMAFTEWVFSATGQTEIERSGLLPLNPEGAKRPFRIQSPGRISPIDR